MSRESSLSGFERWRNNVNPAGSQEEYQIFLQKNRPNVIVQASVVPLPDGSYVPSSDLTYAEICSINHEHVKQGYGQQ